MTTLSNLYLHRYPWFIQLDQNFFYLKGKRTWKVGKTSKLDESIFKGRVKTDGNIRLKLGPELRLWYRVRLFFEEGCSDGRFKTSEFYKPLKPVSSVKNLRIDSICISVWNCQSNHHIHTKLYSLKTRTDQLYSINILKN